MSTAVLTNRLELSSVANTALKAAAQFWFVITLIGQLAFAFAIAVPSPGLCICSQPSGTATAGPGDGRAKDTGRSLRCAGWTTGMSPANIHRWAASRWKP